MRVCIIVAVFACYVPSSSSFGVQLQRCSSTASKMVLQASLTTTESAEPQRSLLKRRGLFKRKSVESTNADEVSEPEPVVVAAVVAQSAAIDYDGMTVIGLKEILRERGLQVSGLKDELKIRLRSDDAKTQTAVTTENEETDDDVFNSSEISFLKNMPTTDAASTNSWVKSSSETYNDRKFKDQQIQEEQKNIVRYSTSCLHCSYLFAHAHVF